MIEQLAMPFAGAWQQVTFQDPRAAALADRHYSRQTIGAEQFLPPGERLALLTHCGRAVWGVVLNLDPIGALRWRCTIFRNEGAGLSSDLIREATALTYAHWTPRPPVPLTTEIDAEATSSRRSRRSRPGECFLRAGWRYVRTTNGATKGRSDLVVLEAPKEMTMKASKT